MIDLPEILRLHALYKAGDPAGRRADLRDADLRGAILIGSNLRGAILIGADLRRTDLRSADLRGAEMEGANLEGANLFSAHLPVGYRIATLCFGGWPVTVTPPHTTIACRRHTNAEWLSWGVDAPEIASMHPNSAAWWKQHREAVCAVIRDVMGGDGGAE